MEERWTIPARDDPDDWPGDPYDPTDDTDPPLCDECGRVLTWPLYWIDTRNNTRLCDVCAGVGDEGE